MSAQPIVSTDALVKYMRRHSSHVLAARPSRERTHQEPGPRIPNLSARSSIGTWVSGFVVNQGPRARGQLEYHIHYEPPLTTGPRSLSNQPQLR